MWTLYGLQIGASNKLGGITGHNLSTGIKTIADVSDGLVDPTMLAIAAIEPQASFTTRAIATALGWCGINGLPLASNVLTMYLQAMADGGTRSSGSVHRSLAFNKGILVPKRLSINHGADAELTYDVYVTWDGTNAAVVVTDAVALTSPLVGGGERFTLGAVTLGAYALTGIKGIDLDFGFQVRTEGSDGDITPRECGIFERHPKLTIRGINPDWLKKTASGGTSIPLEGLAGTQLNSKIYLRKRADGGTYVANATAEHISIVAAGLSYIEQPFNSRPGSPTENSAVYEIKNDGTHDILVINTATAIT